MQHKENDLALKTPDRESIFKVISHKKFSAPKPRGDDTEGNWKVLRDGG